ncbi:MAG: acyl dehydratase [Chloroflexota bacterium]|nr:MAG: acyl dehydratase [Chloroflexota bacterium]
MTQHQVALETAAITEKGLNDLRSRIGVELGESKAFIEELSKDVIRHFADGIGDNNPLWRNEEYAARTQYGTLLAPPTILFAASNIVSGYVGGLPGVHAMYSGTNWEWHDVLRRNERIVVKSYLKDLVEKETRFAGRAIQQIYHSSFINQDGKLLAEADSWCFRTERHRARDIAKYEQEASESGLNPGYSEEQIAAIIRDYESEEIRGAAPRYWDDVNEGEALPQIVKGPYTITSAICFDMGWGGLYLRAHKQAFDLFKTHPALGIKNAYGVPEPPERVHWDTELARKVGVPEAYDYGPERISWLGNLVTNWMGDDGFLKRLNVRVRRHNLLGDTTWCQGKIVKKYRENDRGVVDLELSARNQRGEISALGTASVILPDRKA